MNRTVIYPGTFDPITLGHMDLVERVLSLFDTVIVAVAASARKSPAFPLQKRIELARSSLAGHPSVRVCGFEGLLIEFARTQGANVILRGLRAVSDFEYEFQLAAMNRRMEPSIETVFMAPGEQFAFLSATMVREIAELGGDFSSFVDPIVHKALLQKFARG